ncbi:CGNR zinc finger domain-containing protein [Phytoactinopolyspora alkaliphila]|uniref:CGNR zinc finger domain-containing protein n=1 Tax=Phytoactinopolyspora alkaliphila TaxID=1783498 RepID=A0A6N9YS32_9ACTN|nr:CGNR zinc finger domain-containing protein [Phytoactinopolyspora alkaliphila]NED97760.1 CGNR zinc finger domain-containing protein [Phytoactinopolyspora alkaliphila]
MVNASRGQAAPGALESVRELLNTWSIPNQTRRAEDRLEEFAQDRGVPRGSQRTVLAELRDDLRGLVEGSAGADAVLNDWIVRLDVRPHLEAATIGYRSGPEPAGEFLVVVLDAVAAATWPRLKACPDCRWVFYDHTRNGSKKWCLMTAGGPDGRSCGSIAKVRAHRDRARAARPGASR